MTTTTDDLNLRPEPNTNKPPILTIPNGAAVTLLTQPPSNGWYAAAYNGQSGWVNGDYLTGIPEPESPPPDPNRWMPDNRLILWTVAVDQLGKPYDWGGSNAIDGAESMEGQDCSGFTMVCLWSQDVLKDSERLSAQSQYNRFKANLVKREDVDFGDLIFYSPSKSLSAIGHVMMALNADLCIGAQGGGSSTDTLADAVATDGYVRTRKIDYRSDRVAICRPPWPFH